MSKVEHILKMKDEAETFDEFVAVATKIEEFLQEPSLLQQEREALKEIDTEVDDILLNMIEVKIHLHIQVI